MTYKNKLILLSYQQNALMTYIYEVTITYMMKNTRYLLLLTELLYLELSSGPAQALANQAVASQFSR